MKFDFNKKYKLENELVLLRPLELSDTENLLHFSINEPELWQYSLLPASNENELKKYIQIALEKRNLETDYPFIVFDKRTNSFAGSTRFYDIQLSNKSLQLGYTWYGKDFQGTGLNKNCKYLLLEFAFEKMNIERVEFRADNANKKSIAAMKSIGCKEEGVLRSNGIRPNGQRRDSIVLSILKEEWQNDIKENLLKRL
jgi:N-acetyltransferase